MEELSFKNSRLKGCGLMWKLTPVLLLGLFCFGVAGAQEVGDTVALLHPTNAQGVPVHPAPGDNSFVRWPNNSTGEVLDIDPTTGWLQVESGGTTGWIVSKYLTTIPDDTDLGDDGEAEDGNEEPYYAIGTWNIEWLKEGKSRGFPESGFGGPTYPGRTESDLAEIARTIKSRVFASALILNEINGRASGGSDELDALLRHLGDTWRYEIAQSGRAQRVAFLYDSAVIRKDKCVEFEIAFEKIQGADVFARDPLVCQITFLAADGTPRNDLLVVGLHLASGQDKVANHNRAMEVLRQRLHGAFEDGRFDSGESDILISGDLNANRFDRKLEDFWEGYDAGGFDFVTLSSEDGEEYPPTRLGRVPLQPKDPIDYLIASNGLADDELLRAIGHVHHELLAEDFNDFRRAQSDHLPVTIRIRVVPDTD